METIFEILQWAFWIIIFLPGALLIIMFCIFCVFSVMADLEYWKEGKKRRVINFYEYREGDDSALPLKMQIKVLKYAIKERKSLSLNPEGLCYSIARAISHCTKIPFSRSLFAIQLYIPLFNKSNVELITGIDYLDEDGYWLPKQDLENRMLVLETLLKELKRRRRIEIVNNLFKLKQK